MSIRYKLNIPEPCHENWQQMTPVEQGRYCAACRKNVIDFTNCSDREILDYISRRGGEICGRLAPDQLDRYLGPTPVPKYRWLHYLRNLVLVTLLGSAGAKAQSGTAAGQEKVSVLQQGKKVLPLANILPGVINGQVLDQYTRLPVAGASVMLQGSTGGTSTDEQGRFTLDSMPAGKATDRLIISAIGYQQQEVALTDSLPLVIEMTPGAHQLDSVEVICYGSTVGKLSRMGGMSTVSYVTIQEKFERLRAVFQPGMKLYPNPVQPGTVVNMDYTVKESGVFNLQLLNGQGRLILAQSLSLLQGAGPVQITVPASCAKGVYWMRLEGKQSAKIYQAKLVIQ